MPDPLLQQPALGGLYYKPPGRLDVARTITAFGIALLGAIVVGVAYVYIVDWLDEWYYRVAGAAGAGLAAGAGTAWVVRFGRIRTAPMAILLAAALALVCLYAAWVAWAWVMLGFVGVELSNPWPLIRSPRVLWGTIYDLSHFVTWKIEDSEIQGPALFAIWALEAVVIVGCAVGLAWWAVSRRLACHACSGDLTRETGLPKFSARVQADESRLVADVEAKNFDALLALGPLEHDDDPEYNLELHRCRACGGTNVLSLKRTAWTQHHDGRVTVETTMLMNRLLVSAAEADKVVALKWKLPPADTGDDGKGEAADDDADADADENVKA